jgi:hypothetical protein
MNENHPGIPSNTGTRRLSWDELPASVRDQLERLLGHRVVAAASQPGGFSEGLAARARLADGSGVFIKAAQAATPAASHHRREIAVSRRLPASAPAPRLLHAHDDGEWVALVFEEIPGSLPAQPWRREELDRVLAAIPGLVRALTPAPVEESQLAPPRLGGWSDLAPPARGRLRTLSGWAADHLDGLIALESRAQLTGQTLLHGDLYPFNLLLTPDRVVAIDWPHAWIGAPFCDVLTLLSSAQLSGIDPQSLAVASAGPEADPNIVAMMTALGLASVQWLQRRWPATG